MDIKEHNKSSGKRSEIERQYYSGIEKKKKKKPEKHRDDRSCYFFFLAGRTKVSKVTSRVTPVQYAIR